MRIIYPIAHNKGNGRAQNDQGQEYVTVVQSLSMIELGVNVRIANSHCKQLSSSSAQMYIYVLEEVIEWDGAVVSENSFHGEPAE